MKKFRVKTYRFEHINKLYWKEVRDIGHPDKFQLRSNMNPCEDWLDEAYNPNEDFDKALNYYRTVMCQYGWYEVINEANYEPPPHKCYCELKILMEKGCQCEGE